MTDMRAAVLMHGANGAHSVCTLSVRVTHCPPPPVARKLSYPSWKVIVSAYMANTSSRARKSPAFFCFRDGITISCALIELHRRQSQRVGDYAHRGQRHRGGADHRGQQDAEPWIQHVCGNRHAGGIVEESEGKVLADVSHGGLRQPPRPHQA